MNRESGIEEDARVVYRKSEVLRPCYIYISHHREEVHILVYSLKINDILLLPMFIFFITVMTILNINIF